MTYADIFTAYYRQPKAIPGYSLYTATPDGRVFTNKLRKGELSPSVDKNGYVRFYLHGDNGKRKGVYAHQIVALTYIPNPNNKPEVNHIDHDKSNNSVKNLAWVTHQENIQHDWAKGKRKAIYGEDVAGHKYTAKLVNEIRSLFDSGLHTQSELARKYKMPFPTIHVIVRRKQWRTV